MTDLSYSNDALNVRSAFFGAKAIVYVEGDDDVLFWQEVFSRVTDEPFEVEALGGAPALDEYIVKIACGQLQGIAARDSDFLPILRGCSPSPKVVYTFGYSIENSLYISNTITQLVRLWCKSPKVPAAACAEWLRHLALTVSPLVHLDAANAISGSGVATIGDNCSRYMTTADSFTVCPSKVAMMVTTITQKIPPNAIATARKNVGAKPEEIMAHIRGHFLASAVHRYIVKNAKSFGKKVSISADSLYAAAIGQFANCLDSEHPHRSHYLESARSAWQAV
jgi:Protein of unknown function (DUF4435)